MNHIFECILKVLSILILPVFVIGYGIYGIRVWYYNFVNESALNGTWKPIIPKIKK